MGKAARLKAQRRQAATVEHAASVPATALEAAYPVKHQATHEAGHAVVSWSLGIPFDYVSLDTDPPGVWPLARTRQQLGDKWLIGAAGCIADYQARDLAILDADVLKLIFGSPDNRFSLTDRAGAAVVRPDRRPAVMTSGDLYLMATVMADCGDGQPWPASAVVDTWRGCERYVMACTPGDHSGGCHFDRQPEVDVRRDFEHSRRGYDGHGPASATGVVRERSGTQSANRG